MLRPATPLSVIFFVAFVLLLLSTISTPVVRGIPLGRFQGYNFGVLGWCNDDGRCTGAQIGYSTDTESDFSLPSSTRNSLSSILIVHPIAALLTLICFGLAVAAHFHGPSHSPRYLLALLILTIPTLLVALLAFLVDILLFVPHLQWGSWIVLGATILIIGSSIVTCAMRRTLVSRKARKKRIAENADMNGSTYYEQMAANQIMAEQLPKADSPPPMSGDTMVNDSGKQFATFESKAHADGGRRSTDDQTPLNPTPSRAGMAMVCRRGDPAEINMVIGGYGPPPRGYGPPRGRGGYGPPRGGFRGGPPPPGWNGRGRGYGPPPGMIGRGGMPRQGPPPGYASDPYYGNPRGPPPGMPQPPPPAHDQYAPMGIGQAIEMDERTGNATLPQPAYASNNDPRRHDSDWGPGSSLYSGTDPRHDSNQQQWAQSPLSMPDGARDSGSTADHQYSGTLPSSRALPSDQALPPLRKPADSDTYYEDVDPRFAVDSPVPANLLPGQATTTGGGGGGGGGYHATSTPAPKLHISLPSPNEASTPPGALVQAWR
ncbi:pali pH response regulator [Zymoseptoria tritici IPO323]|uniref:Pali pH response regulator n=1 Tax=Zymoseptoria tritici (strain CBS 115943 / IPO323) TaxID=336722 RepID=F9XQ36_ZYMTI|nr:pali pH response regulator [Zymoseptoria tritici IPO323]EGP82724.1 pali pH response regulator [Zymoseptoria tritici IPO323]